MNIIHLTVIPCRYVIFSDSNDKITEINMEISVLLRISSSEADGLGR